ncbi:lipoprotein [Belliella sp. DSM 107340]|uniref:Lipoprotein n=1 Tax=Belliella calami TaxID=2923436 RepID=A0ABS9USE4_9BACT|nr:lipoprotein [Belliella calami]MCH7399542.1 lipoprotein [Belliella calami]
MNKYFFYFCITIILSSCSPGIVGLMKLEDVQALKGDTLYVFLSDRESDINLHKKYNQNRRANRLQKETDSFNLKLEKAFKENYRFSDLQFAMDSEQKDVSFYATIDITENYGERGNQYLVQLNIRNKNGEIVENTFKESSTDTNYNLNYLVKQLNRKLDRKYTQAKKMQGR